jgi:glyoxylase-like metal-dependent hydrolase (beta-lactamase superfamily II)
VADPEEPKVHELESGIVRLTWALPLGIDHVHCYLVPVDGGWLLVDTGLGLAGESLWRRVLARCGAKVVTILVTHGHPDHVGGAADVAAATGAPVIQGATDHDYCLRAWADPSSTDRLGAFLGRHGTPGDAVDAILEHQRWIRAYVHLPTAPRLVREGATVHGWSVLELGGHADGHLCLVKDGILIAGDALLDPISPAVGVSPETAPDPLAEYQTTLERIARLRPRVALAGHGRTIVAPAARAAAILSHHDQRLEATLHAVAGAERTAWEVSHALFPAPLPPPQRRFAVLEALAHLDRLVGAGAVARNDRADAVRFLKSTD